MIRLMNEYDLEQVLEIEKCVFAGNWTYDHFMSELKLNRVSKLYVYEIDDKIIAYCGLWITFEIGQITTIAVADGYRNKGIAREMMHHMIDIFNENKCENIQLEVRVSNYPAINLYKSLGFFQINIRKEYYKDNNEDALILCLPLGGEC